MSSRLLIFGIDGATWDLVEAWVEEGKLPNLARFIKQGSSMTLRSTIPASSPPAWTSIITGKNPGKHGIFDFIRREPSSYNLQSMRADFTSYRSIFDLLSEQGLRVASVNVPLTYPPRPVNGFMVAGLGAPKLGNFTYPADLKQELDQYAYELDVGASYAEVGDEQFVLDMKRVMNSQVRFAVDKLRAEAWDLFMIVLRGTDEAQGYLWHHLDPTHPWHDPELAKQYGDSILGIYQESDRLLGEMAEAAGEDATILILSDHGGGPLHKEVYLNNWLREEGYLKLKTAEAKSSPLTSFLRRTGLTRDRLSSLFDGPFWRRIRERVPLAWQHALIPSHVPTLAESVDWSKSKAYSFGYIGQIYINLKGREPEGIVLPEEYDALISEMRLKLKAMTNPEDGQPVVDHVYSADELYEGPYRAEAPDLNLIMRNMSYIAHPRRELAYDQVFGPVTTSESGTHRVDGLAILAGQAIQSGLLTEAHHLLDVAPTVLYCLGVPVPTYMDGSVMVDVIEPDYLADHPVTEQVVDAVNQPIASETIWSTAEEEEVEERLRALGYLE